MHAKKRKGFSLVEILVVIVVLTVGILTLIRVYPRGFLTLTITRDYATAQAMARREVDRLKTNAQDLPSQIVAVRYVFRQVSPGVWQLILESDPDTRPDDLGPGGQLLANGNILVDNPGGGAPYQVAWRYYNDANRFRRIIAEGGTVPAPRPVGLQYGGLKLLNFGPIVNDPALLLVYSNDLDGIELEETTSGADIRNPRPWNFAYDDNIPQAWFHGATGRNISYKVNFSYWVNDALGYRKVDVIDAIVTVRSGIEFDPATNRVLPFDLRVLAGSPPGWQGMVNSTIQVNRLFDRLAEPTPFSTNYPYEYKVLNADLGQLLFNPASYNYRERRERGSIPLVAQINYDVFDWHLLKEDFRADRSKAPLVKLTLDRIKSYNSLQIDKRRYTGLGIPVPDGNGGFASNRDFLIIDMDTGGIVCPNVNPANVNSLRSYKIDYLRGTIAFASPQSVDPELGNTITLILPGAAQTVVTGVSPEGRNFRAIYMAHNEWAVQVFKAASRYSVLYGLPLSVGQCYVGSSNGTFGGDPYRVYFPWADVGNKVAIREIWYNSPAGLQAMRDQDFLIRAPRPTDPIQLPSIDIREVDSTATNFDFISYGYAVRGVSGTSLKARVIWNSAEKEDVPTDTPAALADRQSLHDVWTSKWRQVQIESYLTRRDAN